MMRVARYSYGDASCGKVAHIDVYEDGTFVARTPERAQFCYTMPDAERIVLDWCELVNA